MHANGIYGGMGSAPAHEPWTPGREDKPGENEHVPKRWRRLRLRRTRLRPSASGDGSAWPAYLFFGIVVIPLLIVVVGFFSGMIRHIF